MKFRYGTRGSALALAQSDWTIHQLRRDHPGAEFEKVVIQTSGDRFAQRTPVAAPPEESVNVKAMFVKEIEEAMLAGHIDFAVHSAKDLPSVLPEGLIVAAYPAREDPRDVFIGGPKVSKWNHLKSGATVATSSLRRQIQLKMFKPDIRLVAMHGNIDTRLKKLSEGAADGIVLAQAGLKRLGRGEIPHEVLPSEMMVPAPGQGALAIEAASKNAKVLKLLGALDDPKTRLAVECERAVMKAMGGGCRTPLGAHAHEKDGRLELTVFWSDEQGNNSVRRHSRCAAEAEAAMKLAKEISRELLSVAKSG